MAVDSLRMVRGTKMDIEHILWEADRRGLDLTIDFQSTQWTRREIQMTVYLNKRQEDGIVVSAELTGPSPEPLEKALLLIDSFPVLFDHVTSLPEK